MTQQLRSFGNLSDGREVRCATLALPGGITAEVLDYGCIVRSLRTPTARGEIECASGFEDLAAYEADTAYHGVVVGRVANRIDHAGFAVDGRSYQVTANEGTTCLHGGRLGLSKRLWRFERVEQRCAVLAYDSPDGEEGFPGRMTCRVRFELVDAETLEIVWEAEADQPTPVNLTHHLYFNLAGDGGRSSQVLDHELTIGADAITPVNEHLIPTGELMRVAGTPFDFRHLRTLKDGLNAPHPQLGPGGGYDHNFVLNGSGPAVRLRAPSSGVALEISTDQPGMQLYGGQGLKPPFIAYGALALEPQNFPDAINRPGFPNALLGPGEVYRRRARYRLTAGAPG